MHLQNLLIIVKQLDFLEKSYLEKMKYLKICYLFVISLFCSFYVQAQNDYIFELVTLDKRANFGTVYNLYEDPTGIIWMGIHGKGLAYYNGENIVRFPLKNEYKYAINNDIFIAKDQLIYLNDGDGVRIFDPILQDVPVLIPLTEDFQRKGTIKSIGVSKEDEDTFIWAALQLNTHNTETVYQVLISKNGQPFTAITDSPLETYGTPTIKSFKQNILVKTKEGILEISNNGQEINHYEIPNISLSVVTTFNWHISDNGTIWIGGKCDENNTDKTPTYNCTLWKKTTRTPRFESQVYNSFDTYSKISSNKEYSLRFISIIEDTPYKFLRENDSIAFATNLKSDRKLKVSKMAGPGHKPGNIYTVLKSKSGILWMGGENGLSKLTPQPDSFNMISPPLGTRSFIEDEKGIVYGSMNWVNWVDRDKSVHIISTINAYDPKKESTQTVFTTKDAEGYWFQANYYKGNVYHNAYKTTLKTGLKTTFPEIKEDLGHAYLSLIDSRGKLWKAHWGEPDIVIYDPDTGKRIKKITIQSLVGKQLQLNDWYERPSDGTIWLGTYGDGVYIFSPEGELIDHINRLHTSNLQLINNVVSGFYEDSKGMMWLGHGAGLSAITSDLKEIHHYTFDEKEPESRLVYGILPEDNDRYLWMSTSKGIFRFDRETKLFTDFPLHPQMMDFEFNRTSFFKSKKGEFFFGTSNADTPTISFFPDEVLNSYQNNKSLASEIIITSFSAFDGNSEKIISKSNGLQAINTIILEPGDKYFSLSYGISDYRSPKNNHYSFYLENYDKGWNQAARFNNEVRYENLKPGKYLLKLREALMIDTIEQVEKHIKVIVKPYWYETLWAKLCLVLLLSGMVYGLFRYSLKQQRTKQEAIKLQELDGLKTKLYTNITHEFRTPLTVIMGMNDNIKGHIKERNFIKRNTKNLLNLVNQLLDLSKLDSGKLTVNMIQGDIIAYIEYLTESFYSLASDKGINLYFNTKVEYLSMDYDEVKMQHIINNLITNAIKFTESGGKIDVEVDKVNTENKSQLQIIVKDTGKGISKEELPHIFERFFQAISKTTVDTVVTTQGGTGIGLSLTKELVEMLGGTITVKSELSWGSLFTIVLPINNNESTVLKPIKKEHYTGSELIKSLDKTPLKLDETYSNKPVLLVVEDNSGIVAYIQSIVEEDYEFKIVTNGQDGIDTAIAIIPDIIITDVMMPLKNGYEVCETLKKDERTSHIPIIMLTAKADFSSKIEGLQTGADAYITKPFEKAELIVRLKKALELRENLQRYYGDRVYDEKLTSSLNVIEDALVVKIRSHIISQLHNSELSVTTIAEELHLSHYQLYRKLRALTGKTLSQFIRSVRLQKALELIKHSDLNISEIAYEVGFNDPNYFTRVFKQEFGKVPGAVRDS